MSDLAQVLNQPCPIILFYTVQSSGVFAVFIPEKTQKSRRLNSVHFHEGVQLGR